MTCLVMVDTNITLVEKCDLKKVLLMDLCFDFPLLSGEHGTRGCP